MRIDFQPKACRIQADEMTLEGRHSTMAETGINSQYPATETWAGDIKQNARETRLARIQSTGWET
jgi:hypothetical protein